MRMTSVYRLATDRTMTALFNVILLALELYTYVIIASAIFSWLYAFNIVNSNNQIINQIGRLLYNLTEPALATDPQVHAGSGRYRHLACYSASGHHFRAPNHHHQSDADVSRLLEPTSLSQMPGGCADPTDLTGLTVLAGHCAGDGGGRRKVAKNAWARVCQPRRLAFLGQYKSGQNESGQNESGRYIWRARVPVSLRACGPRPAA